MLLNRKYLKNTQPNHKNVTKIIFLHKEKIFQREKRRKEKKRKKDLEEDKRGTTVSSTSALLRYLCAVC